MKGLNPGVISLPRFVVVVVVVEGRRGSLSLQSWEGCLDAPTVLPTRQASWERGRSLLMESLRCVNKLLSSVRRLRVLIEKILPDLKIFYGFGLKQVP